MLLETLKTRGLHAAIRFAPAALLDKHHKQLFQSKANEGFDWQRQEYTENVWRLASPQREGDRRSQLKLTIAPDSMTFEDSFPTGPVELFHDNLKMAMDVVSGVFNPRLMIAVGVVIRMTAQSDQGDSRIYLGRHCLRLDDRLAPLGRPVHGMGIKMLLPALSGEGQPNWQAAVKVESLLEDVRQLFIEVDAQWPAPAPWNADAVIDRVRTGHDFITHNVVDFLHKLGRSG